MSATVGDGTNAPRLASSVSLPSAPSRASALRMAPRGAVESGGEFPFDELRAGRELAAQERGRDSRVDALVGQGFVRRDFVG